MDKDIVIAIILIVVLLIFYHWVTPCKIDKFVQEDNHEPDSAFDASVNNVPGDETHGKAFHDEQSEKNMAIPTQKAQIIVFLSKGCPHCIDYDKDNFVRLKGKLEKMTNGNVNVKKIYPDKDPKGLFNKYDVKYVPTAVVLHNNKNSKINGEISPSNSLKTIKNLSEK
jgi:thioredoxin-related protein